MSFTARKTRNLESENGLAEGRNGDESTPRQKGLPRRNIRDLLGPPVVGNAPEAAPEPFGDEQGLIWKVAKISGEYEGYLTNTGHVVLNKNPKD